MSGKFAERPALDGLRAIAALLVVLFHAGVPFLEGGFLGVDVFFVLSGFLITSILLVEHRATGRIGLSTFYARRARRLLPAAILVLVVTAIVYREVAPPAAILQNEDGFVAAALYLSNWLFMAQAQDYFAEIAYPSPVLHYWSLSVEEQFYVVWPALLIGLLALIRSRGTWLLPAMTAMAAGGLFASALLASQSPAAAYFNTFARVYQLLLGAVLAAWVARASVPQRPKVGTPLAALGIVGLIALAIADPLPWIGGVFACVATVMVLAGNELGAGFVAKGLATRPMRALGRWSYSTYLWHWPVIVIAGIIGILPTPWPLRAAAVLTVTLTLAALTYRFIERPCMTVSVQAVRNRWVAIGAGVVGSVSTAIALAFVVSVPDAMRATYVAAVEGQDDAAEGTEAVEVQTASSLSRPTIMVIGDSHANYWRDALSEYGRTHDLEVVFVTRLSCPWMKVAAINPETGEDFRCEDRLWNRAMRAVEEHDPSVVILKSRSILSRELRLGDREVEADQPGWEPAVRRGINAALDDLRAKADSVVLVEPIPETRTSMLDCVLEESESAAVGSRCNQRAVEKPGMRTVERIFREIDRRDPAVVSISLDDFICPDGRCPAVSNGVPTYRDHQHLTWDFAHQVLPELERQLAREGIDLSSGSVSRISTTPSGDLRTHSPLQFPESRR